MGFQSVQESGIELPLQVGCSKSVFWMPFICNRLLMSLIFMRLDFCGPGHFSIAREMDVKGSCSNETGDMFAACSNLKT